MAKSSLLKRTIGAVLLVVAVIGGVLLHPLSYAVFFSAALVVMIIEFYRMALGRGTHTAVRVMMIMLCAAVFLASVLFKLYHVDCKWLLLAFPLLAAVMFAVLFDRQDRIDRLTVQDLSFVLVYLLLPFLITNMLMFDASGTYSPYLFIAVIVMVWMNDVGGYVFGSAFGQRKGSHKLAPDISPKKSWAGVAGCVIFTFVTTVVIYFTGFYSLKLWQWLCAAARVVVFGIFGDLFESLLKRHYALKDSGTIVIGHGGMLDRFDGALFAIPAVTVFFILVNII